MVDSFSSYKDKILVGVYKAAVSNGEMLASVSINELCRHGEIKPDDPQFHAAVSDLLVNGFIYDLYMNEWTGHHHDYQGMSISLSGAQRAGEVLDSCVRKHGISVMNWEMLGVMVAVIGIVVSVWLSTS